MQGFKEIIIDKVVRGRYYINIYGSIYDKKYNKIIYGHINKGYLRVTFMTYENKQKSYYIHVLMLCTYDVDNRDSMTVNHENGDKLNNTLENLKWMTHRDNMKHAIRTGLISNKQSLTESDVHNICKLLQEGVSRKNVSSMTGFNIRTIEGICSGYNWKDISTQYIIPKRNTVYKSTDIETIHEICDLISKGATNKEVHIKTNIHISTINSIRRKDSWTKVSDNYF